MSHSAGTSPRTPPEAIARRYRHFAESEAQGESECYRLWALGVAADTEVRALIAELPEDRRQPNLVFAAARATGAAPTTNAGSYEQFRASLIGRWPAVRAMARHRRTQTNEAGRCAVMLPWLASLPQPLALLEVGTSAGLCLFPDRYSYRYTRADGIRRIDPADGPSAALLNCRTGGSVQLPAAVPDVVWRAGVDVNPLDVCDDDQMDWLRTLVWPGQRHRLDTLNAAIDIVRRDPPRIVRCAPGEPAVEPGVAPGVDTAVARLAQQAPSDATLVIFHSAVLPYFEAGHRARFVEGIRSLTGPAGHPSSLPGRTAGAHWLANEGMGAVPVPVETLPPVPVAGKGYFVLSVDGVPLAYTGPHGQSLHGIRAPYNPLPQ